MWHGRFLQAVGGSLVLREFVRYYSQSEKRSKGFDPAETFPLSYRIPEVFLD